MKYGYFNQFITGIAEDVDAEIAEIARHADKVIVDTLGNRPGFENILKTAKKGDVVYVHSLTRSLSGLTDVADVLRFLYEKGIDLISLKDGFKADHTEAGKVAYEAMILASTLIQADPNHGFYR